MCSKRDYEAIANAVEKIASKPDKVFLVDKLLDHFSQYPSFDRKRFAEACGLRFAETNNLDRYITGDYGERQFRGAYASGKEACAKALETKDRLCERCSGTMGKMSYAAWLDLGGICDRCTEG